MVSKELVKRLTQLVQESDESCQGRGGGDILEGRVEDVEEDGDENLVVMPLK